MSEPPVRSLLRVLNLLFFLFSSPLPSPLLPGVWSWEEVMQHPKGFLSSALPFCPLTADNGGEIQSH